MKKKLVKGFVDELVTSSPAESLVKATVEAVIKSNNDAHNQQHSNSRDFVNTTKNAGAKKARSNVKTKFGIQIEPTESGVPKFNFGTTQETETEVEF